MKTTTVKHLNTQSTAVAAFVKNLRDNKMRKLEELNNKANLYFSE